MKKHIMILVCIALAFCLTACNSEKTAATKPDAESAAQAGPLMVGYGRTVITPEEPMPLRGYGNPLSRISTEVLDDLYASCIAFTDSEDNTVLLFHLDLCTSYGRVTPFVRKAISDETGIPIDNIMVSATHMHSGPELNVDHYSVEPYIAMLQDRMVQAAVAALEDRKTSRMYIGSTELVGMNFVRHYVMNDGSVVGDNFGTTDDKTYVKHVSEADNVMQLLRFTRDGGKDILLVNWQTHPHRAASAESTQITADIVGVMRTYVESQADCNFAYFSGASGNINPYSRISSENVTSDYLDQGKEMGKCALLAMGDMTQVHTGKVQIIERNEKVKVRGANNYNIEMYAFSIGDVGFITAPYEMFDTNGKFIKEKSPFDMTFIVTYANNGHGYMASESAYAYGGYEVEYTGFAKGTAETVASAYVDMLTQLYKDNALSKMDTSSQGVAQDATLYWNVDRGMVIPDHGVPCTFRFLKDGELVSYQVNDVALATRIAQLDLMGLELEGETITGIVEFSNLPYRYLGVDCYVQSMGGSVVKINTRKILNGKEILINTNDEMAVYDLSSLAEYPGAVTKIQKNDGVTVVADTDGEVRYVFVTDRACRLEAGTRYCEECDADVQWYSWHSDSVLPTGGGHYYLEKDVTLFETVIAGASRICLDLNGKTVRQSVDGERIYQMQGATQMTIMDSVGSGVMIPASTADRSEMRYHWGMIFEMANDDCVLNIRSGTLDASECTAQYGCAINCVTGTINMYGGTIKGGTAYGTGSTAIRAGGDFNMYGGTIYGGTNPDVGFKSINIHGGATIRIGGRTTIYGGQIIGGKSDFNGGSVRVDSSGTLKMLGGSISGGECAGVGGGIYVVEFGKLIIGGNANVTNNVGTNVFLERTAVLEIDETGLNGAKIGISSESTGVFAKGVFNAQDAACFVSDVPGIRVVATDKGLALE